MGAGTHHGLIIFKGRIELILILILLLILILGRRRRMMMMLEGVRQGVEKVKVAIRKRSHACSMYVCVVWCGVVWCVEHTIMLGSVLGRRSEIISPLALYCLI